MRRSDWMVRLQVHQGLFWVLACGVLLFPRPGLSRLKAADEPAPAPPQPVAAEAKPEKKGPIGQFLTLSSPIDDEVYGRVSRAALALQNRAQQEQRPGVLVLEITPGSSQFHHVQGLAKFLTTELPSLTTVAWVPETVRGNHAILALACQEIVMQPQAELGDIGLGKPLDLDEQSFVVNLANRRHNKKLSEALVLGMLDPAKEVIWVQIELGEKPNAITETRVVLPSEFDRLLKTRTVILKHETIKAAGTDGVFSGEKARAYNVLVMNTAESRDEVAALYNLPREAMREDPTAGAAPKAMLIHIDDVIEPMLEQFVIRQIDRAVSSGVNLLIFQIESPGGYLLSSFNLADHIADLHKQRVRSVVYIPKQALSGAAIISLGADEIYLTPQAQFGDAGPIEVGPGGAFERAPEKVLSVLKEKLKSLAEQKKRPEALAQAMADRNLQVFQVTNAQTGRIWYMSDEEIHRSNGDWIKGRPVPESGTDMLLTVNGRRAHELQLAEAPVSSFDELKQRLGIPADALVPVSARTWVDTLIYALNTTEMTALLFVVGIMCIYLELHFPTGFFGICSGLCFALFFWSRFLGGTAGWLEVTLFLLGLLLLCLEVFLIPGFGVFGVSGALLILFSLILASQTFVIPSTTEELQIFAKSVGRLSGALLGVVLLAALASRFLPSIPFFSSMVLTPPGAAGDLESAEPRLRPDVLPGAAAGATLVGRSGVATTMLRPAGKAEIDDRFIDVVSDGPFISAGSRVEVVSVTGNRVVVREVS